MLFEHSTFKYVGFGVGINTVKINIRASDDTLRGEFDSRILGLLGTRRFIFKLHYHTASALPAFLKQLQAPDIFTFLLQVAASFRGLEAGNFDTAITYYLKLCDR